MSCSGDFVLTEKTLTHISGLRILPKIDYVEKYNKQNKFSLYNKFSKELKTNFLNKVKVWGKKVVLKKSGSVTHNFIWASMTMPKFRKN